MSRWAVCALVLAVMWVFPREGRADDLVVDDFRLVGGFRGTAYCPGQATRMQRLYVVDDLPDAKGDAFAAARAFALEGGLGVVIVSAPNAPLSDLPDVEPRSLEHAACRGIFALLTREWKAEVDALTTHRLEAAESELNPTAVGFNLSLVAGAALVRADSEPGLRFYIAGRPEVFLPRARGDTAVGGYLEVGTAGGLYYGGGLTLGIDLGHDVAFAPSVGLDAWEIGPSTELTVVTGFFVGVRQWNRISGFDGSLGGRLDGRFRPSDETWAVTLALQLDLTLLAAFTAMAL